MATNTKEAFGLSCPSGGNFYICQGNATEFIGCCTTNPCADGSGKCPTANLRTSSFAAETYADLPRQDCDDSRSFNIWYTCKFNQPPFVGCCNTNPCAEGSCPKEDLVPAKLSGDTKLRQEFLSPTITGAAATATAENQVQVSSHSSGLSAGAIGGIVAGAAVLVIIVIGVLMYRCGVNARWRRERRADWPLMSAYDGETGDMAPMSSPYSGSCSSGLTWGGKRSPYPKEQHPYRSPKHERYPSSTEQQASPRLPEEDAPNNAYIISAPVELVAPIPLELEGSPYNTPELDATAAHTPMISGAGGGSALSSREPSPVPPVYIASDFTPPMSSPQRLGRPIGPALREQKSRSASRGRIRRVERVEDFRPSTRGLSQEP